MSLFLDGDRVLWREDLMKAMKDPSALERAVKDRDSKWVTKSDSY
jgi:hypothetical protein